MKQTITSELEKGDLLRCLRGDDPDLYTLGRLYLVLSVDHEGCVYLEDNYANDHAWPDASLILSKGHDTYFEFIGEVR